MPTYSVAEAKNQLPKLLDQAIAGEEVTITRRGKPIAKIVPNEVGSRGEDRPRSPFDLEWFRRHRVKTSDPHFDSAAMIRAMRDDHRY